MSPCVQVESCLGAVRKGHPLPPARNPMPPDHGEREVHGTTSAAGSGSVSVSGSGSSEGSNTAHGGKGNASAPGLGTRGGRSGQVKQVRQVEQMKHGDGMLRFLISLWKSVLRVDRVSSCQVSLGISCSPILPSRAACGPNSGRFEVSRWDGFTFNGQLIERIGLIWSAGSLRKSIRIFPKRVWVGCS